jgi:DNA-binding LytR/AlgR family response regulator
MNLQDIIFIRNKDVLKKINVWDIVYLEAADNYTKIHTVKEPNILRIPLDVMLSKLPPGGFLRIHRSYAAGVNHLDKITKESAKFTSMPKVDLPVSKSYYNEIVNLIMGERVDEFEDGFELDPDE